MLALRTFAIVITGAGIIRESAIDECAGMR
jgi:hypothetical protein